MNQETTSVPSKDLRSYIATIRQHKWVILITALLLVLATLLFTLRQPKLYTSTARVRVTPAGNATVFGTGVNSIDMPSERSAAQSAVVAGIVRDTEHLPSSPDSLLGGLAVAVEPETDFLVFQYTDPSPRQSQLLANAFANAYLQNRRDLTDHVFAIAAGHHHRHENGWQEHDRHSSEDHEGQQRRKLGNKNVVKPHGKRRQSQVVALIRTQFLKRFESSARAFEMSCQTLLLKLLTFAPATCSFLDGKTLSSGIPEMRR